MLRIATYNIEWFNSLFDRRDRLLRDGEWSSRYNVTRREQLDAIARVLRYVDADLFTIIEAPNQGDEQSTVNALENFAHHYDLRQSRALIGFRNDTQQEIALLYDPDRVSARHTPWESEKAPRFDTSYETIINAGDPVERFTFSKPPLEAKIETAAGAQFSLIGVHMKSKAPHGAKTPEQADKYAILSRRKQVAQARWLRARIDEHLAKSHPLLVLGDFNDGLGFDRLESEVGHSSLDIIIGAERIESEQMRYGGYHEGDKREKYTARFYNESEKRYKDYALDYILADAKMRDHAPRWKVFHPLYTGSLKRNHTLAESFLKASDHFPVQLDLQMA